MYVNRTSCPPAAASVMPTSHCELYPGVGLICWPGPPLPSSSPTELPGNIKLELHHLHQVSFIKLLQCIQFNLIHCSLWLCWIISKKTFIFIAITFWIQKKNMFFSYCTINHYSHFVCIFNIEHFSFLAVTF